MPQLTEKQWDKAVEGVIAGRAIDHSNGYRLLYLPMHPDAHRGYVYEHRVVAEAKIGRPLGSAEQVHHLNRDKADNRPGNLEVVDRSEHGRFHREIVTDAELRKLLMLGFRPRRLMECGVTTSRISATRKQLRREGLDTLFDLYCLRGHIFTPANTYVSPKGTRICRECRRHQPSRECGPYKDGEKR